MIAVHNLQQSLGISASGKFYGPLTQKALLSFGDLNKLFASIPSHNLTAQAAGSGSGLVAAYNFNEGSGKTITDISGNGNNGTLQGGASWTTGKYGGGVSLSAGGQKIVVATSPQTAINGSFTLETWINPTTLPSSFEPIFIKSAGYPSDYALYLSGNTLMWKWAWGIQLLLLDWRHRSKCMATCCS